MNKSLIMLIIALSLFWVGLFWITYNAMLWGIHMGAQAGGAVW